MFPIAVALFEAQQLNKKQNGPWKQMRSDDCTAAWTDWLNDFFFISSGSSTAAQPPSPLVWVLASPRFQSLLPPPSPPTRPPTHPLPLSLSTTSLPTATFFSLRDPLHHFFCLNHSTSFLWAFSPAAIVPYYVCLTVIASKSPGFSFPQAIAAQQSVWWALSRQIMCVAKIV